MILERWSCFGDPTVMTLLWENYLLELVWPIIEFISHRLNLVDALSISRSHIEWLTLLPSGEKKCLQLIKLILWIEMSLLVSYRWWNQRKTYLVIDREYGTNFDVLMSGLKFFERSRFWSNMTGCIISTWISAILIGINVW